jgi:hypothetical protein
VSGFKGNDFNERAKAAAAARKAALEKFRAAPAPDSPEVLARLAERRAIAEAREIRAAERAAKKAEEAAIEAAKKAAEMAAKAEQENEAKKRAAEQVARDLALAAERKAARDAKYAARKARK